jgi:excisionase family DNA binding protein
MEVAAMQQLYTVDEVAGKFSRSARTVRSWIVQGRLRARRVGRSYIVTQDAIDEMVNPAPVDRAARVQEFMEFMHSLNLPRGSMRETMGKELAAEQKLRHRKGGR